MTHEPTRTSRRSFLAQTAALAGAVPFLGACQGLARSGALPKASGRAPLGAGDTIRMGLIGTGGMGNGHLNATMQQAKKGTEKVEVVALSDVCQLRLDGARQKCEKNQGNKVDTYVDYTELLARDDIHCVLIASPEHWHADMAEDAIAAGKDVYLEKPMTLRLDQAMRLYEVTKANPGMIVQVGTQFTKQQKYHEAKRLIADGSIGKPVFTQTSYCRNSKKGEWLYTIDPKWDPETNLDWRRWCGPLGERPWDPEVYGRWRRYRDFSTGIIGDLLVHVMTPMIWALEQGWPTRVTAAGGHYIDKAMENHDQVNLTIEFEKEHTMTVAGSTCNEQGVPAMIRGHHATLFLGGKDCVLRPERHWTDEIDEETIQCKSVRDQDELRLDWFNSVRTRQPNISTVELGTKVMVIVDLATRSMWEDKAYRFDPASMTAHMA